MTELIYIVAGAGLILKAYRGPRAADLAGQHSRCVTGTVVVPCDLVDTLPFEIRRDLEVEWDADSDDDTPIDDIDQLDPLG